MLLSEIEKLNKISLKMLQDEPLNEAYHKDDRSALDEIKKLMNHHTEMQMRHKAMMNGSKDKDMSKHDLCCMAHSFACKHYGNLGANAYNYGEYGNGLPQDYHINKEFYDKLNTMVSKNADQKSKECGVNCE
jgi:hypothetical protein